MSQVVSATHDARVSCGEGDDRAGGVGVPSNRESGELYLLSDWPCPKGKTKAGDGKLQVSM